MKKHIRRIWSVVLAALMCVALLPMTAQAATAEGDGLTAIIPVSVTVEGEEGTLEADIPTETYTFTLEAVTDGAPMPADGTTTLTITGPGSAEFTIDYEKVGVYQYTITQNSTYLTGDNSICNDRGNYDTTVYYVTVTIQNTDTGIGYVVSAHKGSTTGDKCDIVFNNTYDPVPYVSITVNKTWTDNDQTRPDSVSVQLLDGDDVIETVTLKEGNNWSYTWTGLDPYGEHSWDVKEVAVSGYTAEYTTSDDTITIHNVGDKNETTDDDYDTEETVAEEPADPDQGDSGVQTGDTANIAFYVVVMIAAAAVIAFLLVYSRKKKAE